MLAAARAAGHALAAGRPWSDVGSKLRCAVAGAFTRQDSPPQASLALLRGAGAFYAQRVVDQIATRAG
jgi:hypothetical protein